MHGLPYASRNQHGRDIFRLHLVGQRSRWRQHVSGEAEESDRSRITTRTCAIRGFRAKGNWSDVEFLKQVGSPEFNKKLKELSSPTSTVMDGYSAPSSSATAKAICWIRKAPDLGRRSREARQVGSPGRHPSREGHALHRLPLTQDSRQRQALRRDAERIEISCEDCHGTIGHKATLKTSGPSVRRESSNLLV